MELIMDRTQADVDELTSKGVYTAGDLNRVYSAVKELEGKLNSIGYTLSIKQPPAFSGTDWINPAAASDYLGAISAVKSKIAIESKNLQVPESMENFDFAEANDIEKILFYVDRSASLAKATGVFPGMKNIFSGATFFAPAVR